ncbi:MAG TPA: hypothetical protein VGM89_17505 [Puia sp.]
MKSLIRLTHYLFAVLLVIVIVTACSKNSSKPPTPTPPTHQDSAIAITSAITASPWKYDTSGLDTNNDGKIDVGGDTTVVPLCERDDVYTFNKDSSGSVNTGNLHCVVGEAQSASFTWSLSSDNKTLKASFNPILQAGVTVQTMDSVHFTVYRDSTVLGVTYRYIVQLKH